MRRETLERVVAFLLWWAVWQVLIFCTVYLHVPPHWFPSSLFLFFLGILLLKSGRSQGVCYPQLGGRQNVCHYSCCFELTVNPVLLACIPGSMPSEGQNAICWFSNVTLWLSWGENIAFVSEIENHFFVCESLDVLHWKSCYLWEIYLCLVCSSFISRWKTLILLPLVPCLQSCP